MRFEKGPADLGQVALDDSRRAAAFPAGIAMESARAPVHVSIDKWYHARVPAKEADFSGNSGFTQQMSGSTTGIPPLAAHGFTQPGPGYVLLPFEYSGCTQKFRPELRFNW